MLDKLFMLLQKWCGEFRSRSPLHYYGREERPNTGLANKSLLPAGTELLFDI